MTGDDWRDPAFQQRNAGYLSLYIEELIAYERGGGALVGLPPIRRPRSSRPSVRANPSGAVHGPHDWRRRGRERRRQQRFSERRALEDS